MKIATYNILKGGSRRVHWIKMIEDQGVSLLLVQESYPHDEHLPPLLYPICANSQFGKWLNRTVGEVQSFQSLDR